MATVQNIQPLTAEALFDILKKEFPPYINEKLDSTLVIEFAHVADIINISFPEVIEGVRLTVTVTEEELEVTDNEQDDSRKNQLPGFETLDTKLLENHLIDFLKLKAE